MSLIKWMPTHQIEIYGTEYYTKRLPYYLGVVYKQKTSLLGGNILCDLIIVCSNSVYLFLTLFLERIFQLYAVVTALFMA